MALECLLDFIEIEPKLNSLTKSCFRHPDGSTSKNILRKNKVKTQCWMEMQGGNVSTHYHTGLFFEDAENHSFIRREALKRALF